MRAEVLTQHSGRFCGIHDFAVIPVVGDLIQVALVGIHDEEVWKSFVVKARQIWGYRADTPLTPRIVLHVE